MTSKGKGVVAIAVTSVGFLIAFGYWMLRVPNPPKARTSPSAAASTATAVASSPPPTMPAATSSDLLLELPRLSTTYADVRAPGIPSLRILGGEVFLGNSRIAELDPFWLEKDANARRRRVRDPDVDAWTTTATWLPTRALRKLTRELRDRRNLWVEAHRNATVFPGQVEMHVDRDVPAIVFKAVLQALAAAGYPNPVLAVRSGGGADAVSSYVPVHVLALCQGVDPPAGGCMRITGSLPSATLRAVVQASLPRFETCYEQARRHHEDLRGEVKVRFVIDVHGEVVDARSIQGTTLPERSAVECILEHFRALSFPSPGDGPVTATFPLRFVP